MQFRVILDTNIYGRIISDKLEDEILEKMLSC